MKDRVAQAPGQHQAVIAREELAKMQTGEAFTIHLTRDDQPTEPGTPYNKASVLPDELAQRLNLGEDATPADALKQLCAHTWTAALRADGWLGDSAPYTQHLVLEGIRQTDCPHYTVVYGGTVSEKLAQKEAFALVDMLETADNSVTVSCFEEKPALDLTIQLQVNR